MTFDQALHKLWLAAAYYVTEHPDEPNAPDIEEARRIVEKILFPHEFIREEDL